MLPKQPAAAPLNPDALVDRAAKALAGNDVEYAIRLLNQALAAQPDHRDGLYLLALANETRASDMDAPLAAPYFIRAAQLVRKLRDTCTDLSAREREMLVRCFYSEARTHALSGQPEKALDALADAVDAGLRAPELAAGDAALRSIQKLPRFAELYRKLEQRAREHATTSAKRTLAETVPFAFHFSLPSIDGKVVNLDDVKGTVVVVDFWGTWCPPCRKELPHFKELLVRYRDQGLTLIGINYERAAESDVTETVRQFVAENDVSFTCLIGDQATRNQVPDFEGYPTLLFLDRSRTVRAKVVGYRTLIELEAMVELLLGEGAKSN
jgi:thiol-disulfide isomerase/thioredoxin